MTPEEEKLKRDELVQDKVLREQSLKLQARELRLNTLTNPLLLALISVAAGVYANHLVSEHNQAEAALARERFQSESLLAKKRFCYDVLSDLIIKNPERRRESAADLKQLLASNLISDCEGDLRELADYFSGTPAGVEPTPVVQDPNPTKTCEAIKSIRELGWRSGHKTKFCIAKGYAGVHNPFGDYGAGGFCFKGDSQACIAEIQKQR